MQQARTLLLSTQATIPALEASLKQARNALSTLLGRSPGHVDALLDRGSGIPALQGGISVGFPADLLRYRPDVRQAELVARAQNAQIGLAQADLYPSFSLTGSIGLSANSLGDSDFGDLFSGDALGLSVGPSFVWPFLNYGRIKNNVRVQDARLQQALIAYTETVLQAAREAENAIVAFQSFRGQNAILAESVSAAMRSTDLALLRYREGFADYQRVLNAQQAQFNQQGRFVANKGNELRSLIALYKALGGGWQNRVAKYVDEESRSTMETRTNWGDMFETTGRESDAE